MIKDGINMKDGTVHSFLLIGQSNMAGRGDFGEVEPIRNSDCYMLRMGRWQPMSEPINPDRAILESRFHSGISLGASFADEVQKATGSKIGLIPCADGGTDLSQWMPGELLFDHALLMTRLAARTSRLTAILWHQGESDCHSDGTVAVYKEKFLAMINALRRELGAPDIPVIIGELSERITEEWGVAERVPKMNAILHGIAAELPHCYTVKARDLELKPDGIHFNSHSLRTLGKRYAEKFLGISK